MVLFLKVKWFNSVETQQEPTIVSTIEWLHDSVFSRPSSGQHFAVESKLISPHTLWDPIMFKWCA